MSQEADKQTEIKRNILIAISIGQESSRKCTGQVCKGSLRNVKRSRFKFSYNGQAEGHRDIPVLRELSPEGVS